MVCCNWSVLDLCCWTSSQANNLWLAASCWSSTQHWLSHQPQCPQSLNMKPPFQDQCFVAQRECLGASLKHCIDCHGMLLAKDHHFSLQQISLQQENYSLLVSWGWLKMIGHPQCNLSSSLGTTCLDSQKALFLSTFAAKMTMFSDALSLC